MSRGTRIAAFLAIVGMADISLGASIVLSRACCSADCEKCPVSFCKDSSADLAKKIVTPEVVISGIAAAVAFTVRDVASPWDRIFEAPRSGFVRPKRN
jgi:hypothetical protein